MRTFLNLRHKSQLGPTKLLGGADVPRPLLRCKPSFENDDILRPANHHGSKHRIRFALISKIELPHPAHISCREATDVRMRQLNSLRNSHRRTLFRASCNQASDLAAGFHLRQLSCQNSIYLFEQLTVVDVLSDVHWLLLSGAARHIIMQGKGKRGSTPRFPSPCLIIVHRFLHLKREIVLCCPVSFASLLQIASSASLHTPR